MSQNTALWTRTTYEIEPNDIREALSIFLKEKYGIEVKPENITQFGGDKIDERLRAFTTEIIQKKDEPDAQSA